MLRLTPLAADVDAAVFATLISIIRFSPTPDVTILSSSSADFAFRLSE